MDRDFSGLRFGAFERRFSHRLGKFWDRVGVASRNFDVMDWLAPLGGVFLGAWWVGRKIGSWRAGLRVAAWSVGFWFFAWLFLVGRFSFLAWWKDGILGLNWSHLSWWLAALCVGATSGALSQKFSGKRPLVWATVCVLLVVPAIQTAKHASYTDQDVLDYELGFVEGTQVFTPSDDGTSIRLIGFKTEKVNFGLYDADEDDFSPFDNRNASWLGQAMPIVWNKIKRKTDGEVMSAINGGFFGAEFPHIAQHESPIVQNGVARYDSRVLEGDWPAQNAVFGWKRGPNGMKLSLVQDVAFADLEKRFDGALGGVRTLIRNGESLELKPGMGGTTLKCSRTSVAWKGNEFQILIVRDPDGEAASLRANNREKAGEKNLQVGGWNVRDVQEFWEEQDMENAVLFDGGESSQLAYAEVNDRLEIVHSSYHFTRTPFYLNQRPIRFVLPMLPPFEANGGVLNYFYVYRG